MSGICGLIEPKPSGNLEPAIKKMTRTLAHRGSDGQVIYANQTVGFGVQVMNIFKNVQFNQPITNEEQTIFLFADGEIYEHEKLRQELERKGHHFRNAGDCEVIVHLYEELGVQCATHLRGVFAFAIWDSRKNKLLLFRDHLGTKPLYYTFQQGRFLFGSELKAILADSGIKRELNYNALDHYLNYRLIVEPETIFENIYKVLPGHWLAFENGKLEIQKYWEIQYNENYDKSTQEYQNDLLTNLEEAIRLRTMGDFEFGSYLSGGMDSSSVVVLLSRMLGRRIPTFSIAFREKGYDESYYQHIVSKYCNSDHHEFFVEKESVEELIVRLIGFFDQPFGDSSALPSYYLSKMTKRHVSMVFTGDGGDELLAGYTTYPGMIYSEKYRQLPSLLSRGIIPGVLRLAGAIAPRRYAYGIDRANKIIGDALLPFEERYFHKIAIARREQRDKLYTSQTKARIAAQNEYVSMEYFEKTNGKEFINKVNYTDVYFRFMNTVLPKTECTTIANSLIARSPYLDYKLFEFGASVPPWLKVKGFKTKYLLHLAMDDKLPQEIHVKQKHGFIPPLTVWFKDELGTYIKKMLLSTDSRILQYFHQSEIENVLKIHDSGKKDLGEHLWGLLGFEVWHRNYLG
jgi:asparagine synthase (glutamine-hydrolysing)